MKMEGSLINRIQEGRKTDEIVLGTDITMYYYSDRTCYYVTEVYKQKKLKVKKYIVLPNYASEHMSNDWKYFKTVEDANAYYVSTHPGERGLYEKEWREEETWTYRYNKWWRTEIISGKEKHYALDGEVSFGVKDYYYDYEF